MTEKEELEYLYQLYLSNQCSAKELDRFFELIRTTKNDSELVQLLTLTWDQTSSVPDTGLVPDFLIQRKEQNPFKIHRNKFFTPFIAAAALVLVISTVYLYHSELFSSLITPNQLVVSSKSTERKQLQLADGTKVWLSPNSKLSYPQSFKSGKRIVSLEGEAFFEVTHDITHPFVIQTGAVNTTVLGTSFNVSAYQGQTAISVTLVTGKVAVALKTADKVTQDIITNNQRITVDRIAKRITKTIFPDAADFLHRRAGIFNYKGTPLKEVIKDLELQYAIKIQADETISCSLFYGSLNLTQPISQTLNKLCTVMETSWKKDEGGKYVLIK